MRFVCFLWFLSVFGGCKTDSQTKSISIGAANLFKKKQAKKYRDYLMFPAVQLDKICEKAVIPIYMISGEKAKDVKEAKVIATSLATFHTPTITISCGIKCPAGIQFSKRRAKLVGGKLVDPNKPKRFHLINSKVPGAYSMGKPEAFDPACKKKSGPLYSGINEHNIEDYLDHEFALFDQYGPSEAPLSEFPHSIACFSLDSGICFDSSIEHFGYNRARQGEGYYKALRRAAKFKKGKGQRIHLRSLIRVTREEATILADHLKSKFVLNQSCNAYAPSRYDIVNFSRSIGIGLNWLFHGTCIGTARIVAFKVNSKLASWRRKNRLPYDGPKKFERR